MFTILKFLLKVMLVIAGIGFIVGGILWAVAWGAVICVLLGILMLGIAISLWRMQRKMKKCEDGSYEYSGKNYYIKSTVFDDGKGNSMKKTFAYSSGSEVNEATKFHEQTEDFINQQMSDIKNSFFD